MEKSVFVGAKYHETCSKMKLHELDLVTKSMEDVMKGLQALRAHNKAVGPAVVGSGSNEVQMKFGSRELLQVLPHSFHGSIESSPALRDRGIPSFIPMFDGESNRTFVSWLYEVECFFRDALYSENLKFDMVLSRLKGSALLWYNVLNISRMVKERGSISKWCELKFYMKQNFLSSSTLDKLWNELRTLKQGSLSVNEYANVFEELHFVCDANVECVQKGVRFYHGLKPEISEHINVKMNYAFDEVYEIALCVEERLASTRKIENLLHRETLACVEDEENEITLNQVPKESCLDVMVEKHECVESTVLTQPFGSSNDENGVPRTVITQGAVLSQKLDHEPPFIDMECSDSSLVRQNIRDHVYDHTSKGICGLVSCMVYMNLAPFHNGKIKCKMRSIKTNSSINPRVQPDQGSKERKIEQHQLLIMQGVGIESLNFFDGLIEWMIAWANFE